MKRAASYIVLSVLITACDDRRDVELTGILNLGKSESITIFPRVSLLDDMPFNDLCLLPWDAATVARSEFFFKTAEGEYFIPQVTARNADGKDAVLSSPSLRLTPDGETWLCLSPDPGTPHGPYIQVRISAPQQLRLFSVRWHSYSK